MLELKSLSINIKLIVQIIERNVLKRVMHVQSCCSARKTNCFLTLSFSFSSWFL